jgi:U3 small nucleolar ribonucleoprotein protein IMP4
MLRKLARQRKDYLHRKGLEKEEQSKYAKKQQLRNSLAKGKHFPNELRNEERGLRQEIDLEDDFTAIPRTHMDDEYVTAG